jgi:hypothetical protein
MNLIEGENYIMVECASFVTGPPQPCTQYGTYRTCHGREEERKERK